MSQLEHRSSGERLYRGSSEVAMECCSHAYELAVVAGSTERTGLPRYNYCQVQSAPAVHP